MSNTTLHAKAFNGTAPVERLCEHDDCKELAPSRDGYDYCETHVDYYYCECGQRLEDAAGSPGDGFCVRCR